MTIPGEALPEHAGGPGVGAGSNREFPSTLAVAQSSQSTVLSPRSSSTRIRSGRPQQPQLTLKKSSQGIVAMTYAGQCGRGSFGHGAVRA